MKRPPAPGMKRIARFDVDIDAGPCQAGVWPVRQLIPAASTVSGEWVDVQRLVGTLRLRCTGYVDSIHSRACMQASCDSIRAVPGGSALEDYPDVDPLIALSSGGGFDGRDRGGVNLFPDGTVQYHGPSCTRWRGRRGHVSARALSTLMKAIEGSGFLAGGESEQQASRRLGGCFDDVRTSLAVRGTIRTVGQCTGVASIAQAIDAVHAALWPNPCE